MPGRAARDGCAASTACSTVGAARRASADNAIFKLPCFFACLFRGKALMNSISSLDAAMFRFSKTKNIFGCVFLRFVGRLCLSFEP